MKQAEFVACFHLGVCARLSPRKNNNKSTHQVKGQGKAMPLFGKSENRLVPSNFHFFHQPKENVLEMVKVVHVTLLRKVISELEKQQRELRGDIEMYQNSLQAIAYNLSLTEEILNDFHTINNCIDVLSRAIELVKQVETTTPQQIAEVEKKLAEVWFSHKNDLRDVFSMPNTYCKKKAASYLITHYEKEIQYLQEQLKEIVPIMNTLNSEKLGRLRKQEIYKVRVKYLTHLREKCEKELNQKKEELEYYLIHSRKTHLIVNSTQDILPEGATNTLKPH